MAEAEAMGHKNTVAEDYVTQSKVQITGLDLDENVSDWCCMYCVLSLQMDFVNEKPKLQHYIEGRGYIYMFLPKFHCELNSIKMFWGFMKYCMCILLFYLYGLIILKH